MPYTKISFEDVKKETKVTKTANKKADIAKSFLSEAQVGECHAENFQMDSELRTLSMKPMPQMKRQKMR